MEIRDSQILITTVTSALGREVALMCAENQAHLHLLTSDENPMLVEELTKAGAKSVRVYPTDLANSQQLAALTSNLQAIEFDILFNNAEQSATGFLEEQEFRQIDSMLQVNVHLMIQLTHALLPGMLKRNRGKIINLSNVAALMNFPGTSTYAASKAAVLAFTNSLRAELKPTAVTTLLLLTPGLDTSKLKDIPQFYGAKLDLGFLRSPPAKQYAQMIREAILEDLAEVKPSGFTGAGLLMAQHLPRVFENLVQARFKRS